MVRCRTCLPCFVGWNTKCEQELQFFLAIYQVLSSFVFSQCHFASFMCRMLMQWEGMPPMEWQIGKTKLFLRGCVHEPLEEKRLRTLNFKATVIQKTWKGQRQRCSYIQIRNAAKIIQASYLTWRARIQFLRRRRAAVVIQAYLRGMFAREVAAALREAKRVEEERRRQEALEEERKLREKERLEIMEKEAAEKALSEAER